MLVAQLDQQRRNVDLDRAGVEAGSAETGGVRQRAVGIVLGGVHAGELRGEDGADRSGVRRSVGVAARAFVHRADVETGRAADAVERLAADPVGEGRGASVVEQHQVEGLRPVAGRDSGPQGRVRVHPLAGGGARQQLEEDLQVLVARQHLLDAHDGDQGVGQRQAHAAVALRLDDGQGAGLRDAEVGSGDGDLRRHELLAQIGAGRCRQVGGDVVQGRVDARDLLEEDLPDLVAVAVDGGHQDVRGLVVGELHDELGEVRLVRGDADRFEVLVEADLLGGHRLDLDDLLAAGLLDQPRDDLVGLAAVPGPVDGAAALGDLALQFLQQCGEPVHRVGLDGRSRVAQLLPVGQFAGDVEAFGADGVGGLAEVAAQLCVAQVVMGGGGELPVATQVARAVRGAGRRRGHAEKSAAHRAASVRTCGEVRVAERIWARCRVRVPDSIRESPPPMCIRQDESPAVHTAASVVAMLRILSWSIAVDVSAFFTAKVPPNPQQASASGSSTRSIESTALSSRSGLSPTRSMRREWQVGWYVTRCGKYAPTSVAFSTSTRNSESSYVLAFTVATPARSAASP